MYFSVINFHASSFSARLICIRVCSSRDLWVRKQAQNKFQNLATKLSSSDPFLALISTLENTTLNGQKSLGEAQQKTWPLEVVSLFLPPTPARPGAPTTPTLATSICSNSRNCHWMWPLQFDCVCSASFLSMLTWASPPQFAQYKILKFSRTWKNFPGLGKNTFF